jgi:predicted HTH transcriptional regulator
MSSTTIARVKLSWNGLDKGSIFDDALDDKEISGNLIYLLQGGCDFVKNNSKVRFEKSGMERIDKPDYAERAVAEALVNALIHRDYITMGAEVHVDMYDNRLEITSPGGMYKGRAVQEQDINQIESERRNPILADLFHRMRYMERRGSGLKKILNETKNLPGFRDDLTPQFYSDTSFRVTIYNVNYSDGQTESGNTGFGINCGLNFGINCGLNETQQKIIKLFMENPAITTQAVADSLGISRRAVDNNISQLKKAGLVEREGAKKKGRWVVKGGCD